MMFLPRQLLLCSPDHEFSHWSMKTHDYQKINSRPTRLSACFFTLEDDPGFITLLLEILVRDCRPRPKIRLSTFGRRRRQEYKILSTVANIH